MPRGRVAAAGLSGLRDSGAGLGVAAGFGNGGLDDYEDHDTYGGVVNDPRKNFVSLCLNNNVTNLMEFAAYFMQRFENL